MQQSDYPVTVTVDRVEPVLRGALLGARRRARRGQGEQLASSVASLRKRIEYGHAVPCRMILEITLADIQSGTPLEDVRQFGKVLDGILSAAARARDGHPVLSLTDALDAEEPTDAAMDHAQWRAARGHLSTADKIALRTHAAAEAECCLALVASIDRDLFVGVPA